MLGAYDRTNVITPTNLATDLALSKTTGDLLYGEVTYDTSNFPATTSVTFKAAGGAALPAGGNVEYINVGVSPAVDNENSITRFVVAESSVTAGVQCMFGTLWIDCRVMNANLSGGGTPMPVIAGLVIGGGGP
jgi:hypothetical protein